MKFAWTTGDSLICAIAIFPEFRARFVDTSFVKFDALVPARRALALDPMILLRDE
jgi:hypothetical protein